MLHILYKASASGIRKKLNARTFFSGQKHIRISEKTSLFIHLTKLGLNIELFENLSQQNYEGINNFIKELEEYKLFETPNREFYFEKIIEHEASFYDSEILESFQNARNAGIFEGEEGALVLEDFFDNLPSAKELSEAYILLHQHNLLWGKEGLKNRAMIIKTCDNYFKIHHGDICKVSLAKSIVMLSQVALNHYQWLLLNTNCLEIAKGICIIHKKGLDKIPYNLLLKRTDTSKFAYCLSIFIEYNLRDSITEQVLLTKLDNNFEKNLQILVKAQFFNDPNNREAFLKYLHENANKTIDLNVFFTKEFKINFTQLILNSGGVVEDFIDANNICNESEVFYAEIAEAAVLLNNHKILNLQYFAIVSINPSEAIRNANVIINLHLEGLLKEEHSFQNLTIIFGEDFMEEVHAKMYELMRPGRSLGS